MYANRDYHQRLATHAFCETCYAVGHRYKNCNHPNIQPMHTHLFAMNVEYRCSRSAPTAERPELARIMRSLPASLCRTLIAQYTPAACKDIDYTNITQWKNRPHEEKYQLPSRISILSRMCANTALTMVSILYEHLAMTYLRDYPHTAPATRMRLNDYQNNLRYELNRIVFSLTRNTNDTLAAVTNTLVSLRSVTEHATGEMSMIQDAHERITSQQQQQNEHDDDDDHILAGVNFHLYRNHSATDALFRSLIIPEPTYAPMTPPMEETGSPTTPPPAPARRRLLPRPPQTIRGFAISKEVQEGEAPPAECGICWDQTHAATLCSTNCCHNFCITCITQQAKTAKTALQRRAAREHVPRRERTPQLTCALCRTQVNTLKTWTNEESTPAMELDLVLRSESSQQPPPSNNTDALLQEGNDLLQEGLDLLTELNTDEFV